MDDQRKTELEMLRAAYSAMATTDPDEASEAEYYRCVFLAFVAAKKTKEENRNVLVDIPSVVATAYWAWVERAEYVIDDAVSESAAGLRYLMFARAFSAVLAIDNASVMIDDGESPVYLTGNSSDMILKLAGR